mgnify:CR=1 FL=1
MAKSKKTGVMDIGGVNPLPWLTLHGEHAKPFVKHKIGGKVKFVVNGTKASHRQYNDSHTVGFNIDSVIPAGEQVDTPQHNKKAKGVK